ncbi:MAG TPA: hypothetical protein VM493_05035, partial [Vicinamibacterales bacterium]|nr:hypothetical protein [Vicinamibacterales bacterium]
MAVFAIAPAEHGETVRVDAWLNPGGKLLDAALTVNEPLPLPVDGDTMKTEGSGLLTVQHGEPEVTLTRTVCAGVI